MFKHIVLQYVLLYHLNQFFHVVPKKSNRPSTTILGRDRHYRDDSFDLVGHWLRGGYIPHSLLVAPHDSFWPVMLVMLVMAMVSMVSMIGPKCFSGFSEHSPVHFCTEVTSHKVVQNLHQRSSIVGILKSVPTFRDLRSCARWPWH